MKKKVNSNFLGNIIAICFIIALIATAVGVQININELKDEKQSLEQQLKSARYNAEKLQNEYDKAMDDEHIIQIAKERLKYREPGEIIYYNDLYD